MKTPQEVASGTLMDNDHINSQGESLYTLRLGALTVHNISERQAELMQDYAAAAIEADREQRDRLADGTGRFTVEFDKPAWSSATVEDQEEWVNRAVVALNGEVYVTKVEVGYHD